MREEVPEAKVVPTVTSEWVALMGPTAPLFLPPPEHFQGRLGAKGRNSIPRQLGRSASCPNMRWIKRRCSWAV